jgi:transketolase
MGLEDLAMFGAQPNFAVFYPCDAVSTWRAVELAAQVNGPAYIRTTRPKTPVIYEPGETFRRGQAKVLRQSEKDDVTIVAGGVTVFEALEAHEELLREGISSRLVDLFSVQPVDRSTLEACARETNGRFVTVEDHYAHGGLGDAVLSAVSELRPTLVKLGVRAIPRSGESKELMDRFGISSSHIRTAVKKMVGGLA